MLEQRFRGFFALGISFWIFFQGFVNLGMALGMLPTKRFNFPISELRWFKYHYYVGNRRDFIAY